MSLSPYEQLYLIYAFQRRWHLLAEGTFSIQMTYFCWFQHSKPQKGLEWMYKTLEFHSTGSKSKTVTFKSNYLQVFELLGFLFTSFALVIRAEKSFKEGTLPCSSTALVTVTCNYQTYITRNMAQEQEWTNPFLYRTLALLKQYDL